MNETMLVDEVFEAAIQKNTISQETLRHIAEDSRAIGAIQMLDYQNTHNEFAKYLILHKIKSSREYKKNGLTWEQFCEAIGIPVRTVDSNLKELSPVFERYRASFSNFFGIEFNKVRALGRQIAGDHAAIEGNTLVIGDQRIEITSENKEDVEAAINRLIENQRAESEKLEKRVQALEKKSKSVVNEATKELKSERDDLLKEVERLRAVLPDDAEGAGAGGWSDARLKVMTDTLAEFSLVVRRLVNTEDDSLAGDRMLQGKISGLISTAEGFLSDLRRDFEQRFVYFE